MLAGGFSAWKRAGFPIETHRAFRDRVREIFVGPRVGGTQVGRRSIIGSVLLRLVDSLTTREWLLTWVAMVVFCGIAYCRLSGYRLDGLTSAGVDIERNLDGLATCLYFSVVTATSLGYGDVIPVGLSHFLAITEAAAGMLVFGAIIAKLLSHRQEQLIEEFALELRNLNRMATLAREIFSDCIPTTTSPSLTTWLDKIQSLANSFGDDDAPES